MDELATTSFAPATTWRILGWSALTVETPRLSVDVQSAGAHPLRSQKDDSGKTGKRVSTLVFGDYADKLDIHHSEGSKFRRNVT